MKKMRPRHAKRSEEGAIDLLLFTSKLTLAVLLGVAEQIGGAERVDIIRIALGEMDLPEDVARKRDAEKKTDAFMNARSPRRAR